MGNVQITDSPWLLGTGAVAGSRDGSPGIHWVMPTSSVNSLPSPSVCTHPEGCTQWLHQWPGDPTTQPRSWSLTWVVGDKSWVPCSMTTGSWPSDLISPCLTVSRRKERMRRLMKSQGTNISLPCHTAHVARVFVQLLLAWVDGSSQASALKHVSDSLQAFFFSYLRISTRPVRDEIIFQTDPCPLWSVSIINLADPHLVSVYLGMEIWRFFPSRLPGSEETRGMWRNRWSTSVKQ